LFHKAKHKKPNKQNTVVNLVIAVGDRMILEMQDFDFAQIKFVQI